MTKQDYELLASTIKNLRRFEDVYVSYDHVFNVLTRSLATEFAQRNPRFDEDIFLKACGLPKPTQEKEN